MGTSRSRPGHGSGSGSRAGLLCSREPGWHGSISYWTSAAAFTDNAVPHVTIECLLIAYAGAQPSHGKGAGVTIFRAHPEGIASAANLLGMSAEQPTGVAHDLSIDSAGHASVAQAVADFVLRGQATELVVRRENSDLVQELLAAAAEYHRVDRAAVDVEWVEQTTRLIGADQLAATQAAATQSALSVASRRRRGK